MREGSPCLRGQSQPTFGDGSFRIPSGPSGSGLSAPLPAAELGMIPWERFQTFPRLIPRRPCSLHNMRSCDMHLRVCHLTAPRDGAGESSFPSDWEHPIAIAPEQTLAAARAVTLAPREQRSFQGRGTSHRQPNTRASLCLRSSPHLATKAPMPMQQP